ncbi:hypothetical protein FH972_026261 [Carpinus fangiana]|uniref:Uncharacterized protein n=1 Tax=Carpinus fangiana TaxID=176857 RepID=A0A5N6L3M3_9ROSI|nr:hypothetical protein FH972_026261 [Carpinus fangiana]
MFHDDCDQGGNALAGATTRLTQTVRGMCRKAASARSDGCVHGKDGMNLQNQVTFRLNLQIVLGKEQNIRRQRSSTRVIINAHWLAWAGGGEWFGGHGVLSRQSCPDKATSTEDIKKASEQIAVQPLSRWRNQVESHGDCPARLGSTTVQERQLCKGF